MTTRTIVILLLFVILTWGGSAGIAFGVVELTGGGPRGEQGEQGPRGPRGPRGSAGSGADGVLLDDPCTEAIDADEEGLSTPGLSAQQVTALYNVAAARCDWD